MSRSHTLAVVVSFIALASSAAIPVRWTTDTFKVKPLAYECYHGETLDLAATLTAYGEPLTLGGETARLYWQTNGMGSAWWNTNAEVRVDAETGATNVLAAVWSGAFDCGAKSVTGFVGVEGKNYRAAFTLTFRDSPGFAPSVIPIPPKTLDWATIENANVDAAPFVVKGGAGGITPSQVTNIASVVVTNDVAAWALRGQPQPSGGDPNAVTNVYTNGVSIVVDKTADIYAPICYIATNVAASAAVTNAGAVAEAKAYADAATNGAVVAATNLAATAAEAYTESRIGGLWDDETFTSDAMDYLPYALWRHDDFKTYALDYLPYALWRHDDFKDNAGQYIVDYAQADWNETLPSSPKYILNKPTLPSKTSDLTNDSGYITNAQETDPTATAKAEAVVAPIATTVTSISNRQDYLEGYIAGQRVRVSVTNYYGNTSGELPNLRIEENITVTNVVGDISTETNYWQTVWDENNKYTNFLARSQAAIAAMTNDLYRTYYALLMERLNTKAPRAWGTLTSAGEAAPAGSVWHTEPNTVFAGGTEYAHAMVGTGIIGVLTTKGAAVYTDGETGRFHFTTDDRQYYFGMNIATRYEIGCATDGITVTKVGNDNLVQLTYNVTMSNKPILYYKTNLTDNVVWEQITDSSGSPVSGASVYASWEQSPPAGSEICNINGGTRLNGFFKATVEYAGSSKFETNMMADLAGGIVATNQTTNQMQPVEPYISNGNVLWRIKQ